MLIAIFEEDDNFRSIIQTNLMGVWHVTKVIANRMKNHKIHKLIIDIIVLTKLPFLIKKQRLT